MASEVPRTIPRGPIKLTIDEYMELPNDGKRYQILDGELDVTPAPVPRHQGISKNLEHVLFDGLEKRGLGKVFYAPIDVVLDDHNIVQPDIIFIRTDRLGIIGPANVQGPPDLVVEILSPSTRRTDVLVKSALYARFGIPQYWIVDPDLDRLEVFRLERGAYVPEAAGSRPQTIEPQGFPGLSIPLEEVFAAP